MSAQQQHSHSASSYEELKSHLKVQTLKIEAISQSIKDNQELMLQKDRMVI